MENESMLFLSNGQSTSQIIKQHLAVHHVYTPTIFSTSQPQKNATLFDFFLKRICKINPPSTPYGKYGYRWVLNIGFCGLVMPSFWSSISVSFSSPELDLWISFWWQFLSNSSLTLFAMGEGGGGEVIPPFCYEHLNYSMMKHDDDPKPLDFS